MDDGLTRAPEFPSEAVWLNTDRPMRLRSDLRGHVVLLDFWTYCCINCMHVLADLAALEARFADEPFVVVGVHAAKFPNEAVAGNVRSAIARYGVKHPVVLDEGLRLWDSYAVNAWPTLVLIGPDGRIVGQVSGEGHRRMLEGAIERTLREHRTRGTLAAGPLRFPETAKVPAGPLAFPAKVVADAAGGRLFVVDANHNRVLQTTWPDAAGHCAVTAVIGSGAVGATDGAYGEAAFHRPQGAALAGEVLYVADTENHLVRRVDLRAQVVTTVLGTGVQTWDREGGKSGREQGLNSPWDVAVDGTKLYISMAGQHQIFVMNVLTGMAEPLAGTGRENLRDDESKNAYLAQPSGMALDKARGRLYFADAEVSAVRYVDLTAKRARTLVGGGLFVFGDVDGDAGTARLQHPLGVTVWGDEVLVADTYNHKIRRVHAETGAVTTLAGIGAGCATDAGALVLNEPAGLTAAGEVVFVADTNGHRIVRLDVRTGAWREITIAEGD